MQAIITKYIPATNTKPSRIKASCERGSLTVGFNEALQGVPDTAQNEGDAHRAACDELCARFDAEDAKKYGSKSGAWSWSRPKASGQIPTGEHVFCFIPKRVYRRAAK